MKVSNELKIYELNGRTPQSNSELNITESTLLIESHWNYQDRVVINFNGQQITLLAIDLLKAINNASNH